MRHYINILLLLILSAFSFGQAVKRVSNESAEQFATRLKPGNTELTHKVIEAKWNQKNVIIAFYQGTYRLPIAKDHSQRDYINVIATLYIQSDSETYNRFNIDTIGSDGGDPEIQSAFFVNADSDSRKELAILVKWPQRHPDYGGDWYGTLFYKFPEPKSKSNKLEFLEALSESFYGCDCEFNDRPSEKAKFKTSAEVKAELIRLGYKQ